MMRNSLKKSLLLFGLMALAVACNNVEIPSEHLQPKAVEVEAHVERPVSAGFQANPNEIRRSIQDVQARRAQVAGAKLANPEVASNSKHGEVIYEASCAKCHGFKTNPAPSLEEAALRMDYKVFDTTVTHGRAGMPAHPQLTQMQKESLWMFIESSPAGTALAKNQEGSGCGCGGSCGGGQGKAAGEGCGGGCGQAKAAGEGCGGGCGQRQAHAH